MDIQAIEHIHDVTNPTDGPVEVVFEPWSHLHSLPPGETIRVVIRSPQLHDPEISVAQGSVCVAAWPGASCQIFRGDELLQTLDATDPEPGPVPTAKDAVRFAFGRRKPQ